MISVTYAIRNGSIPPNLSYCNTVTKFVSDQLAVVISVSNNYAVAEKSFPPGRASSTVLTNRTRRLSPRKV